MENDDQIINIIPENRNITISDISSDSLQKQIKQAEQRITFMKRIKTLSLKATNEHDWCWQGDKLYLECTGADKVRQLFQVQCSITGTFQQQDLGEGHFLILYQGQFSWGGIIIDAIGTASTKDGFFKKYKYVDKPKPGEKDKIELPPSEIDKGNVIKKAYTNLMGNGICRILGLRNLTPDDLTSAGLDPGKISKVEYKQQEMSDDKKNLASEMHKMLTEMHGPSYGNELEKLTKWTNNSGKEIRGKRSLSGLSEKQIPLIYGKIKKAYDGRSSRSVSKETPATTKGDHINSDQLQKINGALSGFEPIIGEFLKHFKIAKIEELPTDRFENGMKFISAWI